MNARFTIEKPDFEAVIYYLTTKEGGRNGMLEIIIGLSFITMAVTMMRLKNLLAKTYANLENWYV